MKYKSRKITMFKRISLFLITNLLVMATISIVMNILGIKPYLSEHGLNYESLMVFCGLWGMGGALISLLISKWMAKRTMGLTMIDPTHASGTELSLYRTVERLAKQAGLPCTPEVGIYEAPEMNAFATGPSEKHSLVAVSTGLLNSMNDSQVEAVLGHEISHIKNGDMVTLALIQGVVNAFAMFLSRILAYAISMAINRNENNENNQPGFMFYILSMVFDVLFTMLGSLVVAAFSRWREFRADRGGANLAGRESMISALQKLAEPKQERLEAESAAEPAMDAMKISSHRRWLGLFASHPPLEVRIARLSQAV